MRVIALFLLTCLSSHAATLVSDGSRDDVQAKINDAVSGDTVTIPSGGFTWSNGISISGKAITLQGAGGGFARGSSTTSLAIGTGTKTFTVQTNLGFTSGETIRAAYKPYQTNWMEGTVSSYSDSTLEVDVTSVNGSGTFAAWTFLQDGVTIITNSAGATDLMAVTESSDGNVRLKNFHVVRNGSTVQNIQFGAASNGQPIVLTGCRFDLVGNIRSIELSTLRGVVSDCDFHHTANWDGAANSTQIMGMPSVSQASWGRVSTFGTNDTTGTNNFYIEDCWFFGFTQQGFDIDGGARIVFRNNYFDHTALTSHGMDSGVFGLRHFEIYRNTFIFHNLGTATANLDYWFYIRGGTGVVCSNTIPDITSSQWGNKTEFKTTVFNLRFNGGPYSCWGASTGGIQYPAPRQVGMGYVDGSGSTDGYGYLGDAEPVYFFNNSGTYTVGVENYSPNECGTNADSSADYIIAGRDYYNDGTVKPSYEPYEYPHPLAGGGGGGGGAAYTATAGNVTVQGNLILTQ